MDLIAAGRTLLLRETPHAKPHLWLVLTNPDGNPDEIVAPDVLKQVREGLLASPFTVNAIREHCRSRF